MRHLISFMHISLDGFVAGVNGEMNWIKANEEIFNYVGKRISKGDTALYGRKTYELMEGYWPTAGSQPNASQHDKDHSKWYAGIRKLVLSKTLQDSASNNMQVISDNLIDGLNKIKQEEGPEILLFGSPTATHRLMELGLIDGYWLFVNPIILGKGIPLFTGNTDKVKLQLQHTHQFECGVTELSYLVDQQLA